MIVNSSSLFCLFLLPKQLILKINFFNGVDCRNALSIFRHKNHSNTNVLKLLLGLKEIRNYFSVILFFLS